MPKKNILFALLLISKLSAQSTFSYTSTQILIPKASKTEIDAKYFIDTQSSYQTPDVPDSCFEDTKLPFTPGFYSGTLWLDISFENSKFQDGTEYFLYFGHEHLDEAEIFIEKNNIWTFVGRTGRGLPQEKISMPDWKMAVHMGGGFINVDGRNHLRIHIKSHSGVPINVTLMPERAYLLQNGRLLRYFCIIGGIGILVAISLMLIGIGMKDFFYIFLSLASICFTLIQIQDKGIGPVLLWNFLSPHEFSVRLTFILKSLFILFFALSLMFYLKGDESKSKPAYSVFPVFFFAMSIILLCFVLPTHSLMYETFVIFFSTANVILAVTIVSNLKGKFLSSKIVMCLWLPLIGCSTLEQIFQLMRNFSDARIFNAFDKESFAIMSLNYFAFSLPALYTSSRRLRSKYKALKAEYMMLTTLNESISENLEMGALVLKELAETSLSNLSITNLLEEKMMNSDDSDYLRMIHQNNSKLNTTLCAMLALENPSTIQESPVLLLDYFNDCMKEVESASTNRGCSLSVTAAVASDTVVLCDTRLLEILFIEFAKKILVTSAIRTKLSVYLEEKENFCVSITTRLSDNSEKAVRSLYEEEKKAKSVGLRFIKSIAEIYSGSFKVKSLGEETRFSINLSLKKIQPESARYIQRKRNFSSYGTFAKQKSINPSPEEHNFSVKFDQPPSILVAQSDLVTKELLEKNLSSECNLIFAQNGMEALGILESEKSRTLDLILCEKDLPLVDGKDLLKKCAEGENLKNIPFIMLVNEYEDGKYESEILKTGAVCCMEKSAEFRDYIRTMQAVLEVAQKTRHTTVSKISSAVAGSEDSSILLKLSSPKEEAASNDPAASAQTADNILSKREREIARLIASGKSDKEIAEILTISPATVATHNKKIFKKLEVHSRVELMTKLR